MDLKKSLNKVLIILPSKLTLTLPRLSFNSSRVEDLEGKSDFN
jgi:hypothetical protein